MAESKPEHPEVNTGVYGFTQCSFCTSYFPFMNILTCRKLPGNLTICMACHQRCHPRCISATSALSPDQFLCQLCHKQIGTLVCTMCTIFGGTGENCLEGVLMCNDCSVEIHTLYQEHHKDHFYPPPTSSVVTPQGPVLWQNAPDANFDVSSITSGMEALLITAPQAYKNTPDLTASANPSTSSAENSSGDQPPQIAAQRGQGGASGEKRGKKRVRFQLP